MFIVLFVRVSEFRSESGSEEKESVAKACDMGAASVST